MLLKGRTSRSEPDEDLTLIRKNRVVLLLREPKGVGLDGVISWEGGVFEPTRIPRQNLWANKKFSVVLMYQILVNAKNSKNRVRKVILKVFFF